MAEQAEAALSRRRPAAVLLLAGVAALVVSVGALTGVLRLLAGSASVSGGVDGGWICVAVLVVAGLALVLSPARPRRSRRHR